MNPETVLIPAAFAAGGAGTWFVARYHCNRQAHARLAAREEKVAALVHELRAPLTPIIVELELLSMEPNSAGCRDSIDAIRRHVVETSDILALLLDEHSAPSIVTPTTPLTIAPLVASKPRILLVDDHEATRLTIKQLLWRSGYVTDCAGSVKEALAKAHDGDFLIADLDLPDGTGHDLLRTLAPRGIRGVAISGFSSPEDHAAALDAGFVTLLVKPLDIKLLLALLPQGEPPASPVEKVA